MLKEVDSMNDSNYMTWLEDMAKGLIEEPAEKIAVFALRGEEAQTKYYQISPADLNYIKLLIDEDIWKYFSLLHKDEEPFQVFDPETEEEEENV